MDPVSDMITIIKNGYLARKQLVSAPYSGLKERIAKKLLDLGFLSNVEKSSDKKTLKIELLYIEKEPVLKEVKRISKPSLRIYRASKDIPRILSGRGEVLISTPKGILTGKEAKKANLGGELILKVW